MLESGSSPLNLTIFSNYILYKEPIPDQQPTDTPPAPISDTPYDEDDYDEDMPMDEDDYDEDLDDYEDDDDREYLRQQRYKHRKDAAEGGAEKKPEDEMPPYNPETQELIEGKTKLWNL